MRLLIAISILLTALLFPQFGKAQEENDFLTDKLIVKIKEEYTAQCQLNAIDIPSFISWRKNANILNIKKAFPQKHNTNKLLPQKNKNEVRLDNIYYFELDNEADIPKLLTQLNRFPFVEYAEANYKNYLTYTPSDTLNNKQWYLFAVKAFEAWDIEKGDTNVVIATTDTGIDTSHQDLMGNLAYNYDDPINGIDDDGDGYIDNYYGWNTGSNNNDISYHNSGHGSNVAGIAAAVTDNVRGISGGGFNSRQLIVKIDNAQGQLTGAYEAIVYAADHGAFAINCSWGSYTYSEFANDIVNYATINKGAMVICGAGNGPFSGPNAAIGVEKLFYPAAYKNAVAVGATLPGDTVKESSNYGYWLDIFAPGEDMLTTNAAGGYNMNGGTSMAAPLVAAGAALVKAHFPHLNNKAVLLQLKNTADKIEGVNENKYQNKTGSGRVNFYRALTDTINAGILMENIKITDRNDESFVGGDSLFISADFINYLKDANNLSISISTINNELQGITTTLNAAMLLHDDTLNNESNPFVFKIPNNLPIGKTIGFRVTIVADNFEGNDYFEVNVNNDFITLEENNLRITFSSKAGIGYSNEMGEGIVYKGGNSLLYEGSFAIAENAQTVLNEFREGAETNDDFNTTELIAKRPAEKADVELKASFEDKQQKRYKINSLYYLFKQSLPNSAFYVYQIINKSNQTINDIYAGMLMDWDVVDYSKNKVGYDVSRKMSVVFATDTNLYCGIRVLTNNASANHNAIDNIPGGAGGIDVTDGFSLAEKFKALSEMRDSAGIGNAAGNDILDAISVGPFNLEKDSSFVAAFAIIVSNNLDSLNAEADSAQAIFSRLTLNLEEHSKIDSRLLPNIYPNPTQETSTLEFTAKKTDYFSIKIYDINGRIVLDLGKRQYAKGVHRQQIKTTSLQSGQYVLQLKSDAYTIEKKLMILKP